VGCDAGMVHLYVEDVPEDEMARRAEEWAKQSQG
jgi:hypothetical protein